MATHGPINGVKVSRALLVRFDRSISFVNSITFLISFARGLSPDISSLSYLSSLIASNLTPLLVCSSHRRSTQGRQSYCIRRQIG